MRRLPSLVARPAMLCASFLFWDSGTNRALEAPGSYLIQSGKVGACRQDTLQTWGMGQLSIRKHTRGLARLMTSYFLPRVYLMFHPIYLV